MITLNFSDCNFSDCNGFRPTPFGQTEATCLENDFGDSFSDSIVIRFATIGGKLAWRMRRTTN